MVAAWRVVKEKWAETAFSGEGARLGGGRFNSAELALVYTSESLALSELEILVNLPTDRLLGSYVCFRVGIPEDQLEACNDLPSDWRTDPAPETTKALGDRWIQEKRSLALKVPSAVVPSEHNYLINPAHSQFDRLQIEGPFDPNLDTRLT